MNSYVIALPKEWINSLGTKEKDQISDMMQSDHQTMIKSVKSSYKTPEKREKTFNVD